MAPQELQSPLIVVGVDGSDPAARALHWAAGEAGVKRPDQDRVSLVRADSRLFVGLRPDGRTDL